MKKFLRWLWIGIGFAFLLLILCIASLGDGLLHLSYLDVGQGDAILIRTPAMEYILIDGGPDGRVLQEISTVMPFYERTIDLLVLSHPHADHVDGLVEVLERYDVGSVLLTGVSYRYPGYERFLDLVTEKKVKIFFVNGEYDYRFGSLVFDIVYPLESLQGAHFENINNSSIAMRVLFGSHSFFFSGDLELEGEAKIIKNGIDVRADVLKAGHHGSRTSNSEEILDLMRPSWAIVSCGVDNSFQHPHSETVRNLQKREVPLYRTDIDGRVDVVTDGYFLQFDALNRGS